MEGVFTCIGTRGAAPALVVGRGVCKGLRVKKSRSGPYPPILWSRSHSLAPRRTFERRSTALIGAGPFS